VPALRTPNGSPSRRPTVTPVRAAFDELRGDK
jgi:hypothetical protein